MSRWKKRNYTNPSCFKNNAEVWQECELEGSQSETSSSRSKKINLSTTIGIRLSSLFENTRFVFRNDYLKDAVLC